MKLYDIILLSCVSDADFNVLTSVSLTYKQECVTKPNCNDAHTNWPRKILRTFGNKCLFTSSIFCTQNYFFHNFIVF